MSKINDRSLQLKMIFNDEDLRKPDHDAIMKMLDAWLRVPENLASVFRSDFPQRELWVRHELLPDPLDNEIVSECGWDTILRGAKQDFEQKYKEDWLSAKDPWPHEPARPIQLQYVEWEVPMFQGEPGDRRGMPVGFFDLRCICEAGRKLTKVATHAYRIGNVTKDNDWYGYSYEFEEVGLTETWKFDTARFFMFFEVKTEIRSVGELMRQLQLYGYSGSYRGAENARTFVVAPPHADAEAICKQHGIRFLRVDRGGLTKAW